MRLCGWNSPIILFSLSIQRSKKSKKIHLDMCFGCLSISLTWHLNLICFEAPYRAQARVQTWKIKPNTSSGKSNRKWATSVLSLVELELAILCMDYCLTWVNPLKAPSSITRPACDCVKLQDETLKPRTLCFTITLIITLDLMDTHNQVSPLRSKCSSETLPVWKCKWPSIVGFSFLCSFLGEGWWVIWTPKARFVFQLAEFLFLASALRAEP